MFRALFTAASGMTAQQMNLDNVANNLSNASTAGFRRRRVQFQDLYLSSGGNFSFGRALAVSRRTLRATHEEVESRFEKVHAAAQSPLQRAKVPQAPTFAFNSLCNFVTPRLICIGTSTGGPKALQQLLPALPEDLPVPVVVVQHMPKGFTAPFARRLDSISRIRVSEATQHETLEAGHVYIAPAGVQLTFVHRGLSTIGISLSPTPTDTPHIPSVDVMMLSAAELLRDRAMGVIMTGMGNDGERGMRAIFRAGGYTIGQDEQSCVVYGMPRSCATANILRRVTSLNLLAQDIVTVASEKQLQRTSMRSPSAVR
jgi:chemotaxis response regulator CheB